MSEICQIAEMRNVTETRRELYEKRKQLDVTKAHNFKQQIEIDRLKMKCGEDSECLYVNDLRHLTMVYYVPLVTNFITWRLKVMAPFTILRRTFLFIILIDSTWHTYSISIGPDLNEENIVCYINNLIISMYSSSSTDLSSQIQNWKIISKRKSKQHRDRNARWR